MCPRSNLVFRLTDFEQGQVYGKSGLSIAHCPYAKTKGRFREIQDPIPLFPSTGGPLPSKSESDSRVEVLGEFTDIRNCDGFRKPLSKMSWSGWTCSRMQNFRNTTTEFKPAGPGQPHVESDWWLYLVPTLTSHYTTLAIGAGIGPKGAEILASREQRYVQNGFKGEEIQ